MPEVSHDSREKRGNGRRVCETCSGLFTGRHDEYAGAGGAAASSDTTLHPAALRAKPFSLCSNRTKPILEADIIASCNFCGPPLPTHCRLLAASKIVKDLESACSTLAMFFCYANVLRARRSTISACSAQRLGPARPTAGQHFATSDAAAPNTAGMAENAGPWGIRFLQLMTGPARASTTRRDCCY